MSEDTELLEEIRSLLWHISDRELEKINQLLRDFGIEYPLGARGVEDALAFVGREDEG